MLLTSSINSHCLLARKATRIGISGNLIETAIVSEAVVTFEVDLYKQIERIPLKVPPYIDSPPVPFP